MISLFPSMTRIKNYLLLADKPADADKNAKRSLILGISAFVFLLIPEITIILSGPLGILALTYGRLSLNQRTRKKNMAAIGKVLGFISVTGFGICMLIALIIIIVWYIRL